MLKCTTHALQAPIWNARLTLASHKHKCKNHPLWAPYSHAELTHSEPRTQPLSRLNHFPGCIEGKFTFSFFFIMVVEKPQASRPPALPYGLTAPFFSSWSLHEDLWWIYGEAGRSLGCLMRQLFRELAIEMKKVERFFTKLHHNDECGTSSIDIEKHCCFNFHCNLSWKVLARINIVKYFEMICFIVTPVADPQSLFCNSTVSGSWFISCDIQSLALRKYQNRVFQ